MLVHMHTNLALHLADAAFAHFAPDRRKVLHASQNAAVPLPTRRMARAHVSCCSSTHHIHKLDVNTAASHMRPGGEAGELVASLGRRSSHQAIPPYLLVRLLDLLCGVIHDTSTGASSLATISPANAQHLDVLTQVGMPPQCCPMS
jgi:hypothetical protein